MALDFYNLIKFGSSLYLTEDGLSTGVRIISTVTGLEAFQLDSRVQTIKALSGKVYQQYTNVIDVPITINVPLIGTSMHNSIVAVIQAAITGSTTFQLAITGEFGTFTFNAKPGDPPVSFSGEYQNGKVKQAVYKVFGTLV